MVTTMLMAIVRVMSLAAVALLAVNALGGRGGVVAVVVLVAAIAVVVALLVFAVYVVLGVVMSLESWLLSSWPPGSLCHLNIVSLPWLLPQLVWDARSMFC